MTRTVTLAVAVGFAVVGLAAPSSAHHNTISGTVECATGGGWAVTWRVVNSERITETITASNRTSAVPVGTQLSGSQVRRFTETITTQPTAPVTLTLSARWTNNVTNTSSGSIAAGTFADGCDVTTLEPPAVPVVDECGPGNAHYGTVPDGPWTVTTNPDGSLTVTATPGTQFPGGQTSVTYPVPVDSDVACPTPPVTPPEVLPTQVRVVKAAARKIDKCGRRSDLYKVGRRSGVVYKVRGKVIREGVWLKARGRKVVVRAKAANDSYDLKGKRVWKLRFTHKPCAKAPEIAPDTGS